MFKFKRGFSNSLRGSPSKAASALREVTSAFRETSPIRLHEVEKSPIKRIKLDTPPATPILPVIQPPELSLDALRRENLELDEQIRAKQEELAVIEGATVDSETKFLIAEELIEIAKTGIYETRDVLNEIFHAASLVAKGARALSDDAKKSHLTKFEKFAFDSNQFLEATQEAIQRKTNQLNHEIELHERTIMTYECHMNQAQKEKKVDEPEQSIEADQSGQDKSVQDDAILRSVSVDNDDCVCVALVAGTESMTEVQTHQEMDLSGVQDERNMSETTITCDDGDITDIDVKDDENERSFTPCQAQRPQ